MALQFGSPSPSVEDLVADFTDFVQEGANVVPICKQATLNTGSLPDAADVFLKIKRGSYSFLLESAQVIIEPNSQINSQEDVSAQRKMPENIYSIIGTEPFKIITVGDPSSEKSSQTGPQVIQYPASDPLNKLESELSSYRSPKSSKYQMKPDILNGAAVGYISYDCIQYFEPKLSSSYPMEDKLNIPESLFMMTNSFVVFDHRHSTIRVVALCAIPHDQQHFSQQYQLAVNRIDELIERLNSSHSIQANSNANTNTPNGSTHQLYDPPRERYESMVLKLKEHICEGDIIQAVPSQRSQRDMKDLHAFDVYTHLRKINPSPYMFFVDLENFFLVGASPELLVKVTDGHVITHPIAGTRPRGKNNLEDEQLAKELLADIKEQAEHIMLVDLGRNDINRVCQPLSTKVDSLMHIERYSHVMHIVSQVSGTLRPECTPFDAFRSIFPAGTVSGAPKIKAMELIAGLEKLKRGVYAGAVGYFSFNNNIDTCIAIRTMVVKDNIANLQAGGGIVYDSVPSSEYQEIVNKMAVLARSLEVALAHPSRVHYGSSAQNLSNPFYQAWSSFGSQSNQKAIASSSSSTSQLQNFNDNVTEESITHLRNTTDPKKRLLLIDNYDSFTWNLYQYLSQLGQQVIVFRNDKVSVDLCEKLEPARVVISPGPSWPKDAGVSNEVILRFAGRVPILGVCLGHECMVECFGGKIQHCGEIMHGKTSAITHDNKGVYQNLPQNVPVIRYHSLAATIQTVPEVLEPTSFTSDNRIIMGVRHKEFRIEGVQYHPESIKTEFGMEMLNNFVNWTSPRWEEK